MVVRYGQNDSNELLKHFIKGVSSTYCKSNDAKDTSKVYANCNVNLQIQLYLRIHCVV